MIAKMHSLLYGYRKLKAKVQVEKGIPCLYVDEMGYMSPLEVIKQGIVLLQLSDAEKELLKKGGYSFRD